MGFPEGASLLSELQSGKASKVLGEAELRSAPECKKNSPGLTCVVKLSELFLQPQGHKRRGQVSTFDSAAKPPIFEIR